MTAKIVKEVIATVGLGTSDIHLAADDKALKGIIQP